MILDEILVHPILSKWFPYFQVYAGITDKAMERLYYVLEEDVTTVEMFHALTELRGSITDKQLASLITKLLNKERGDVVSLYLLSSFFNSKPSSAEFGDDIILAGCLFFEKFSFELDTAHRKSFPLLDEIARACLSTKIASPRLLFIYRRIAEAIVNYKASVHDFPELFMILAEIDSSLFMDTFLKSYERNGRPIQILESIDTDRNPIGQIPKEKVMSWCDLNPEEGFPLILNFINPFVLTPDSNTLQWNPIVLHMLNQPGNKTNIFKELQACIRPSMWSGSLAEVLRERLSPVENLFSHPDIEVANWSRSVYRSLLKNIDYEEESERQMGAHFVERFE